MEEWIALFVYFSLVLGLGVWSSRQVKTVADFNLGNRSLGYCLTAMAAHASDMSSWLFMGYPAIVFLGGIFQAWVGVGLLFFMWLNWTFVAPKIRQETEKLECTTLSAFFEKKTGDETGRLRLISSLLCFLFYAVYISSGLVGLGVLGETLLHIDYFWGITFGIAFVLVYLSLGGYVALAWLDLIQGVFLLGVILGVPLYLFYGIEGIVFENNLSLFSYEGTFGGWKILSLVFGWGLGYFGQPHILTKFMGIRRSQEMHKSRNVGMSWMALSLFGATFVGLIGAQVFQDGLKDPETVFIQMVQGTLHPFLTGLIVSAVIAATINVMSSQLLVMSTSLTEDLFFQRTLSEKKGLGFSRLAVLLVALVAYVTAYFKLGSIFFLVHYAWSGLGASFGPLLLALLYTKKVTYRGALSGLLVGGGTIALWPLVKGFFPPSLEPLVVGFLLGFLSIVMVSKITAEEEELEIAI